MLIPVTSVVRISKEKTVKIIPNALAVATVDERHVFSGFLSREAAYQLMISVWKEALPMCDIDVTTAAAQLRICTAKKSVTNSNDTITGSKSNANSSVFEKVPTSSACTLQVVHQHRKTSNSGISEIDDESSSAISGSEGLVKLLQSQKPLLSGDTVLNNQLNANHSSSSSNSNSNSNPSTCDFVISGELNSDLDISKFNENKAIASTQKTDEPDDKLRSTVQETSTINFLQFRIPRKIHVAYFGLSLVIILALMTAFLFYRISEMKSSQQIRIFSIDDLNTVKTVLL